MIQKYELLKCAFISAPVLHNYVAVMCYICNYWPFVFDINIICVYVNKQRGSDRNLRVSVLHHFQQPLTDVQSLIDSSLCGNGLTIWDHISLYVLFYFSEWKPPCLLIYGPSIMVIRDIPRFRRLVSIQGLEAEALGWLASFSVVI